MSFGHTRSDYNLLIVLLLTTPTPACSVYSEGCLRNNFVDIMFYTCNYELNILY